jgi:hypothetical protein
MLHLDLIHSPLFEATKGERPVPRMPESTALMGVAARTADLNPATKGLVGRMVLLLLVDCTGNTLPLLGTTPGKIMESVSPLETS